MVGFFRGFCLTLGCGLLFMTSMGTPVSADDPVSPPTCNVVSQCGEFDPDTFLCDYTGGCSSAPKCVAHSIPQYVCCCT